MAWREKNGYITIDHNSLDKVPDKAWSANKIAPGWFGDFFEGSPDAEITFAPDGTMIEAWSVVEEGTWNPLTGDRLSDRETPFAMVPPEKQGGYTRYFANEPTHVAYFEDGTDAGIALRSGGDITIDEKGFIIDIWESETGNLFDPFGHIIGNRATSYQMPEPQKAITDMTESELVEEIDTLGKDIAGESRAVLSERTAMDIKDRRIRDLMRQYKKVTTPEDEGYQHRYYMPRPYSYSMQTYYQDARESFSPFHPERISLANIMRWGVSSRGGVPRD